MQNSNLELTIAHLYPKLLNIYGDFGNIVAFKTRCELRGIKTNLVNINIDDDIDIDNIDFFFIGGGQDKQQIEVAHELQKRREQLVKARDLGKVFLSICGGYQLFGKYYQPHDAEKLMGIELLDAYTVAGNNRFIGNVTIESDFVEPKTLVGFENHSGLTYLEEGTVPIGKVIVGNGNNGKDLYEGARKVNVFGTYLHGSLLPKNPHFTDYLIKLALNAKYGKEIELEELDSTLEFRAHNAVVGKAY